MPTTTAVDITVPVYDPKAGTNLSHQQWGRVVAREVRRRYQFEAGSDEEQELEAEAYKELARCAVTFKPDTVPPGGNVEMAFRGYAKRSLKFACQKLAERLRNGGMAGEVKAGNTPPRPQGLPGCELDLDDERRRRQNTPSRGVALPLVEDSEATFRLVGTALEVDGELGLHEWATAVGALATRAESLLWALGDLIVYGVNRFGPDAWDQLGAFGYASETARKAERVSRRFPSGIRIPALSWSHHMVCAFMPVNRALRLLRKAERENWSRNVLAEVVRAKKKSPAPVWVTAGGTLLRVVKELEPGRRDELKRAAAQAGLPWDGDRWPALERVVLILRGVG